MKAKFMAPLTLCFLLGLAACGPSSGCKTAQGRYDPASGNYDTNSVADPVVVSAQNLRATALSAFDLFVTTETAFRPQLWKLSPDIKHAADNVRKNAKGWLDALTTDIRSYQLARTEQNKIALSNAMALVTQMLQQAQQFTAEAQKLQLQK